MKNKINDSNIQQENVEKSANDSKVVNNSQSKKKIIIFVIVALVVIGLGVGGVFLFSGEDSPISSSKLESIDLKVEDSIPVGEQKLVKVVFNPKSKEEDITWESSDEKVATVSDGNISAISPGNVKITATTTSGVSKSKIITIYIPASDFSICDNYVEIYVGDTKQLTATITPENATFKDVEWNVSDSSVATVSNDGVITAKSSGEATITATTEEGLKAQCSIVVKEKPIEYSGSGDKIISNVNIPSGVYKAVMSNNGARNFIVTLYEDGTDSYGDLLANEIGSYNGSVVVRDGETSPIVDGMLEIKSSGKWSIKFEPVSGTIQGKSVSGSGDVVTGWFIGDGKRQVVNLKNSGAHNFIVEVYDEYGNSELLANEIGSYNGQATFVTKSYSKYYFSVISSGSWSISFE